MQNKNLVKYNTNRAARFVNELTEKTYNYAHLETFINRHNGDRQITSKEMFNIATRFVEHLNSYMVPPAFSGKNLDTLDDIHELLKMEINNQNDQEEITIQHRQIKNQKNIDQPQFNMSTFMNIDSFFQFARIMNPEAIYKKAYITLDTKYARFLDNNTRLQWDFSDVLIESPHSTNIIGKVRDIVQIQLYSLVTQQYSAAPLTRGSLFIEEFRAQSFIAPNGKRFHTLSLLNDITNDPIYIDTRGQVSSAGTFSDYYAPSFYKYELLSGFRFNEGIYHFNPPMNTPSTITLQIGNPFTNLSIPKTEIAGATFSTFDYDYVESGQTRGRFIIDLPEPHYITSTIYSMKISGFTTDDPVTDADFITYINSMEFTKVDSESSTQLIVRPRVVRPPITSPSDLILFFSTDLPADTTGVKSSFTVILETYRIIANMELTYIDPNLNATL